MAIKQAPDGGMVQTEACRLCGAHIFWENVASFGLANLEVAEKGAQKYKKYDTKFMLCTPWEISPICSNVITFKCSNVHIIECSTV